MVPRASLCHEPREHLDPHRLGLELLPILHLRLKILLYGVLILGQPVCLSLLEILFQLLAKLLALRLVRRRLR